MTDSVKPPISRLVPEHAQRDGVKMFAETNAGFALVQQHRA